MGQADGGRSAGALPALFFLPPVGQRMACCLCGCPALPRCGNGGVIMTVKQIKNTFKPCWIGALPPFEQKEKTRLVRAVFLCCQPDRLQVWAENTRPPMRQPCGGGHLPQGFVERFHKRCAATPYGGFLPCGQRAGQQRGQGIGHACPCQVVKADLGHAFL